jgi:voltage-gated potassium channel
MDDSAEKNGKQPVTLRSIVNENDTRWGRVFELFIQFLIVVSLVTFSIETLPDLSGSTQMWLRYTEIVTVIFFTMEYLLRLFLAEKKPKFVFSFFGIIDLLAILPFYITTFFLSTSLDLRSVRAFRMLRLFRAFKIIRYSKAISRFHHALLIAREEIILFLIVTVMLIYFSAVGIYYFEHDVQPDKFTSVFHSLWWSVSTLTTVGYGDIYPVTIGGKIFTFGILLIGLGIISVPAGLVSSALSKAREMDD